MQRILVFEDQDDEAFRLALSASALSGVLSDMDDWLRCRVKYDTDLPADAQTAYAAAREQLLALGIERDIRW